MELMNDNGTETKIDFNNIFNLENMFKDISDADKKAWNDRVIAEEQREKEYSCKMRFLSAGFGEKYADVLPNMQMFKNIAVNNKAYDTLLNQARVIISAFTMGNKNKKDVFNVIITGAVGAGKTTYMASLAKMLTSMIKGYVYGLEAYYSCEYTTSFFLCDKFYKARGFNSHDTVDKIIRSYVDADILFIDEIGKAENNSEKDILFSIIDARYRARKSTVIASNYDRNTLPRFLGEATSSRLVEGGKFVTCDFAGLPDLRMDNTVINF